MATSTMALGPAQARTSNASMSSRSSGFLSRPVAVASAVTRRAAPARSFKVSAMADSPPYDAEGAKRNADDAREWIARWRAKVASGAGGVNPAAAGARDPSAAMRTALERQIGGGSLGPEPYDEDAAKARAADARAWIARWRAKVSAPGDYDEEAAKERAADARAWINRWRSKVLAQQRQARWPAGLMTKEQEVFALGLQLSRGDGGEEQAAAGGEEGAGAAEEGCTDPRSENYNPKAVYDDGSCLYNFDAFDLEA